MKDIVEFCGYTSAYSLLNDHMNKAELSDLLEIIVDSPEDAKDLVLEEVERIAKEVFEWIDWEKLQDDADEEAYQRYRDGD
ncbi:MAG: hypothetical protein GOVbin4206_35 [Prokaryotic dsDNA virus sp.]|nr:MAG: hypothetical protein GOVbin4206_35 [Prokaryotic dsDNA virus sp.]|tara:strand:+ start:591 stop:833 length:243 start_codon:yes stop_codon:yes gene_type:complete